MFLKKLIVYPYFNSNPPNQFVVFKALSYCFEKTIGFDVKALFARLPVSRLINSDDITKEF